MPLSRGLNAPKFNSDQPREYVEYKETESRSSETDGKSLNKIRFKTSVNFMISSNIQ